MTVKLLDLAVSIHDRLRQLPYLTYLCAVYVMANEVRSAYLGLLSEEAKLLSAETLDVVRLGLQNGGGRVASDNDLSRRWQELNEDPAEDGPPGWFAAMFVFAALAGEVTAKEPRWSAADWVADAAKKLPESDGPEMVGLVQIDPDEEAEEGSPRVQMLRKFGQVIELVDERARLGLVCEPDEIRSAVF